MARNLTRTVALLACTVGLVVVLWAVKRVRERMAVRARAHRRRYQGFYPPSMPGDVVTVGAWNTELSLAEAIAQIEGCRYGQS
jgi:hypothetical protein